MKIRVETNREIHNEDFWAWISELIDNGIPIQGKILLSEGVWNYTTDLGYTKVTTTYRIIER